MSFPAQFIPITFIHQVQMLDAESIGLLPALERDAQGGPLLDEDEALLQQFERVQLVIGAAADQGEGTLFITEG